MLPKSPTHTGDREYYYTKDNGNADNWVKDGERSIKDVGEYYIILYVQEVVTLQKKYLKYLHQKIRFTPLINYYDILG